MTMSSNSGKLPTVRQSSSEGEPLDAVSTGVPSLSKLIRTSSSESGPCMPPSPSDWTTLSSIDSEKNSLGDDATGQELEAGDTFDANYSPHIQRIRPQYPPPTQPSLSRALSLPLPAQLQHPHRPIAGSLVRPHHSDPVSPEMSQFKELSLELADSVQMVIQTMLQISPAQLLDPAKEQFSACSLAVPTPSMSAMFTAMKNLNYISANMSAFAGEVPADAAETPLFSTHKHSDFDIGELLQNAGDALSGTAAQVGVDLVLFHEDVGLKHVWVKGDESGMSYLLAYLLRQILTTAQGGDTVELGLFVGQPGKRRQNSLASVAEDEDPFRSSPTDSEGPLRCTIKISHKFAPASDSDVIPPLPTSRLKPTFSSLLLRRLLNSTGGTFTDDDSTGSENGRTSSLSFTLEPGVTPVDTPATITARGEDLSADEPSLEQLMAFVDRLKDKKVDLYASSKSCFAHHLTSYLTAWGMDVSPRSADGEGSVPEQAPSPTTTLYSSNIEGYTPAGLPPKAEPRPPKPKPLSFIFIDDDVAVLGEQLEALKGEYVYPLNLTSRKRPSLVPHHRPRSSPQVAQVARMNSLTTTPVVVLHFTSLANFKLTKEMVQSKLASYRGVMALIPEIMIIPKPAGPRRLLTALHTALTKPVVDSSFSPIATSPGSPGILGPSSIFAQHSNPRTPSAHRPTGSRTNSDRSTRSVKDIVENYVNHPPSPLSMQDRTEYFPDAVTKLGDSAMQLGDSARAGVMIQSPDGQQRAIFFSPRADKNVSAYSTYNMERDKGHLSVTSASRRPSLSSLGAAESVPVTFSSLRETTTSEGNRPPPLPLDTQPIPSTSRQPSRGPVSTHTGPPLSNPSISKTNAETGSRKVASPTPPGSPLSESSVPPLSHQLPKKRPTPDGKGLSPAPQGKKGKSPADGNIVPPISVLIVEDNPIERAVLLQFMKLNKIKYDVATDGREAVEKWKAGTFHLILMDIQMPIMDGIEATRAIRRIERANAGYLMPSPSVESEKDMSSSASDESDSRSAASPYRSGVIIVALTASSLQSDRIAALAAGCNDFLTKPVSKPWLHSKLIEWGSIKALSMYADMTPDATKTQKDNARNVAERLHVPKERRAPPSPVQKSYKTPGRTSPPPAPSTAGLSSASVAPNSGSSGPHSAASSAFWSPGQPSAVSFRTHFGIYSPQPSAVPDSVQNSDDQATPTPQQFNVVPDQDTLGTPTSSVRAKGEAVEKRFDPNASTSTLKQGDILRALAEAKPRTDAEPTDDMHTNASTESSLSPSPSPTTPGSPVTPATSGTGPDSVANFSLDDKLDVSLPGGYKEVYAEAGPASQEATETREESNVVSP